MFYDNLDSRFPKLDILPLASQELLVNTLLEQIMPSRRARKKDTITTFKKLCANLTYFDNPLIFPLNRKHWSNKKFGISYTVIDQIHALADNDMILTSDTISRGQATEIKATEKYHEYFDNNRSVEYKPREWVICREWIDTGEVRLHHNTKTNKWYEMKHYIPKIIEFEHTTETKRRRDILDEYYHLAGQHEVTLNGDKLQTALRCIYSEKLNRGGRLYTGTYWGVQKQSKEDRQLILIDGEPTTELDFCSLHPNMLYQKNGLRPQADQYSMILDMIPELTTKEKKEIRGFVKILFQSIINTNSPASAIKSGNFEMNLRNPDGRNYKSILESLDLKVLDLVGYYEQCHKSISQHFYKSIGTKLQYLDSKIALRVIKHFTRSGIVVLPIHDSFIIQSRYTDDLRSAMQEAYCNEMRVDESCPIK